ncbi:tetratricopeptide repeat protein [Qipengyuania spongiae]|uniref:Tetratricopeptide repeat protein n=1 Tax=Qipengyuania spongiae TaxID=2909673 RepID=A0ABY5SVI8_9SPHN|nr:tetratricopeptide repeat protein [Qipengyuania spongiae]UVI38567.1 tetratricopeptide repeat protein [Qipengyuania spongiae]
MSWLPILALAGLAFVLAAFVLKLPRNVWALFGAALLFGLAGYAMQGMPGVPSAPRQPTPPPAETGELLVEARREFFPDNELPSRFVITADAFARRGDYAQAAQFLRNAVEENPADTEAWVALGNALTEHAEGRLTQAALHAYSRAEQAAPDNPAAGYFAGFGFLRSGEAERAREIWAGLVEDAPEDAPWRPVIADRLARLDALLGQSAAQNPVAPGAGVAP